MGNVNNRGNGRTRDVEQDAAEAENPQPSRYAALLGPMLGGSFPTSLALYSLLKDSSDKVKLLVFGGFSLGVFVVASGLAATSLGSTVGTARYAKYAARYAKYAALAAVTIALCLFTSGLCTLFVSQWYKIGCGLAFAVLIALLDIAWLYMDW